MNLSPWGMILLSLSFILIGFFSPEAWFRRKKTDAVWFLRSLLEHFIMRLAWKLPRRLVTWCFIRVVAAATTGCFSSTILPSLNVVDALKRWDES